MLIRRISLSPTVRITWLLLLTVLVAGCPTKTIQYPVEHERLLRLDQALESLRSAYERKDRTGFRSMLSPLDQTEELQRQAELDFEAFHTIALEFRIERVVMAKDDLDVLVNWQGTWKKDANDTGTRQRGHARLQWIGTGSILLRGAQGDLPFGMQTKQMLSEPSSPLR
jgi:hypothetical protein